MTSTNDQKKMTTANAEKKKTPFPTPPLDEKKDDEMAPLLPVNAQCPSLRHMPNRPPMTHAATATNSEEKSEKTNPEDMDKDKLSLEDKLAEEDKDKLYLEITGAQKTSNGWVVFSLLSYGFVVGSSIFLILAHLTGNL
jgi:hypothetical protein